MVGVQTQGAQAYAARHRDVIARIAEGVVNRMRPESRVGKVYSFDLPTHKAQILFPGESPNSLISATFSTNNAPTVSMDASYDSLGNDAPADVVRVSGRPGRYYIDSYLSGSPQNYRYELSVVPIGGVIDYIGTSAPASPFPFFSSAGFLKCDGSMKDPNDYPLLFAKLGTTLGGDGITTFKLPTLTAPVDDMTLTVADSWLTPATNWTVAFSTIVVRNGVASINASGTYTGTDIAGVTSGDIGNLEIATIADTRIRPNTQSFAVSTSSGRMILGYISSAGSMGIASTVPNVAIASGASWSLGTTYLVNNSSSRIKLIRAA